MDMVERGDGIGDIYRKVTPWLVTLTSDVITKLTVGRGSEPLLGGISLSSLLCLPPLRNRSRATMVCRAESDFYILHYRPDDYSEVHDSPFKILIVLKIVVHRRL